MTAPAPARWLAWRSNRIMVGRVIAAAIIGVALGFNIIADQSADQKEARALTRQRYESDFESHRAELLHADESAPSVTVIATVAVMLFFLGAFELTAAALGRCVGLVDAELYRRTAQRRARVLDDTDE